MRDDIDTDYCDRLPGQHTGRPSLELQASEAAEWQHKVHELESELNSLRTLVKHFRDVIAEYHDMAIASLSAGESSPISPEATQDRGLATPAMPSAAAGASGSGDGDTVPPEVGKKYVCRNGKVTGEMRLKFPRKMKFPFAADVDGTEELFTVQGRWWFGSDPNELDLIAEYVEPQPAGSPDDWVDITDPDHIARDIDECRCDKFGLDWSRRITVIGRRIGDIPMWEFRCRRKDLPQKPEDKPLRHPWNPMIGTPSVETALRQFMQWHDMVATNMTFAEVQEAYDMVATNMTFAEVQEAYDKVIADAKAALSASSDKPRMRRVVLRELRSGLGQTVWTTTEIVPETCLTGRTAEAEVPE